MVLKKAMHVIFRTCVAFLLPVCYTSIREMFKLYRRKNDDGGINMKNELGRSGLNCMLWSLIPLVLFFVFYKEGSGLFGFLPQGVFWFVQKALTVGFIIGVVTFLASFTVRDEEA